MTVRPADRAEQLSVPSLLNPSPSPLSLSPWVHAWRPCRRPAGIGGWGLSSPAVHACELRSLESERSPQSPQSIQSSDMTKLALRERFEEISAGSGCGAQRRQRVACRSLTHDLLRAYEPRHE